MKSSVRLFRNTYVDSVVQLAGTRAMRETEGVEWAAAAMATPANLATLLEQGFRSSEVGDASAGDLFLAVRAAAGEGDADAGVIDAAVSAAEAVIFAEPQRAGGDEQRRPRSVEEAVRQQPGATIAIVSVPGEYAALEAHKALGLGLDVLLFSDNVSVADEIALKEHAARQGRLVMGPGAGTAMIAGTGLGFANVVHGGRVGVIAAAGTGAQEVMALLDRWGAGVSQVIGLGGRDLSEAVGGRMAVLALEALRGDPGTDVVLMVSKPPAPAVAERVLSLAGDKPLVATLLGHDATDARWPGVDITDTLESGVVRALERLGMVPPDRAPSHGPSVEAAIGRLPASRTTVRGLYSGGTLCYEALVLLSRSLGPVWSNTPIDKRFGLPAPEHASVCLDLGEEEFTAGRPHPMIDPQARVEMLRQLTHDPDVAVILLDIVLGYGAHPDPAGILAPVCREIRDADGPQVVAYVLGTEGDPQGFADQVAKLVDGGCHVTQTAARAALTSAAIARRDPSIAAVTL
jgi:FdrA protein